MPVSSLRSRSRHPAGRGGHPISSAARSDPHLKEYAIRVLQRRIHYEAFYALKDVSLEIEKGEVFGIIGRNGAGENDAPESGIPCVEANSRQGSCYRTSGSFVGAASWISS